MTNSCFFCGDDELRLSPFRGFEYSNSNFNFFFCKKCKGHSLYPVLTKFQLANLYGMEYVQGWEDVSFESYDQKGWKHSLRVVAKLLELSRTVADFGCGTNSPVIELAKSHNIEVFGVEFQSQVALLAQEKMGVPVYDFESFLGNKSTFDLIFLGDVLEHLSPPDEVLKLIRTKLSRNGYLVVQGPLEGSASILNLGLMLWARVNPRSSTAGKPFHVHLATRNSIFALLNRLDFEVEYFKSYFTYWPARNPRNLFGEGVSVRDILLTLMQTLDLLLSKFWLRSGNRFVLTAKLNNLNN